MDLDTRIDTLSIVSMDPHWAHAWEVIAETLLTEPTREDKLIEYIEEHPGVDPSVCPVDLIWLMHMSGAIRDATPVSQINLETPILWAIRSPHEHMQVQP